MNRVACVLFAVGAAMPCRAAGAGRAVQIRWDLTAPLREDRLQILVDDAPASGFRVGQIVDGLTVDAIRTEQRWHRRFVLGLAVDVQ